MAAGAIEDGPYRLRSASDMAWGSSSYGHRETFWDKAAATLTVTLRMILPVLALLACTAALFLYRDTPVPLFLDGTGTSWLTASHLLVPVAFLCVHLTNRRYGPAYAFAQIVIVAAFVVGLVLFAGDQIGPDLPQGTLPTMREAVGVGAAFFVASFISICVFDGARGARWWTAPLLGFLSAAIFFVLVFFPAAYAGTGTPWFDHAVKYMGLLAGEGVLLLIPYWMLRSVVPPLSGFGGY
ncbi:MAG: VUT family protein [Alphaproteobacteria bacterium]|nr:VUT family protein [Alphaproteobacteria bacterium]MDE2111910.1 VUT family protein [Alphaproteobacteria bacterium]MDE2493147.1 VUT family protein [Alphaproteobacteria bacterium]